MVYFLCLLGIHSVRRNEIVRIDGFVVAESERSVLTLGKGRTPHTAEEGGDQLSCFVPVRAVKTLLDESEAVTRLEVHAQLLLGHETLHKVRDVVKGDIWSCLVCELMSCHEGSGTLTN